MLRPSLGPAVALGAVWTFNQFNVVFLVSGGEPDGETDILVSEAYRWAFTRQAQYGYAAAYSVLIFLLLGVVLEFILRRTTFGRSLYIIGSNQRAGALSGIRINRIKLATYVFCGTTAALAGLIMTARTGSTVANAGVGMDFDSLIAAVLGGTSLFGGRGGTLRTIVGVLILGVLNNLLVLLNIPYEAQQIAKGLVFLSVVWMDGFLQKR